MNDLIVCTYCDKSGGMLEEYRSQLLHAGIPFHVEYIRNFPHPSGLPVRFKLDWMHNFASRFRTYDRLVFTDAYDVLFFGTRDQAYVPEVVTFAAERNCFPEPGLADQIAGNTPWRYVNAGMMGGSPEAILDWINDVTKLSIYDADLLDQMWLNRLRAAQPLAVPLDTDTESFYVVSSTLEGGELAVKDGRLWNSACDTYPCWFHFSGGCPTDGVRYLLDRN